MTTTMMPTDARAAVQDLMIEYCYAVDGLDDVGRLVAVFTEDAVADFSAIGLPLMHGAAEIGRFFTSVFADMTHHAHYIGNFRPESWTDEAAVMTAYVNGLGRSRDGNSVDVKVHYRFECVAGPGGWRCRRFAISPLMPMPASLDEIHGAR